MCIHTHTHTHIYIYTYTHMYAASKGFILTPYLPTAVGDILNLKSMSACWTTRFFCLIQIPILHPSNS